MHILFIGGTGQISLPCVAEAVARGHRVSVFNRGRSAEALPAGVTLIQGDMAGAEYVALGANSYDVVCQFMVFTPDQMERDVAVFGRRVGRYVFISSASVYEKPARAYVITEETPAVNPYWVYSQNKIACEAVLRQSALPWTIVRPSHTVRNGLPTMMNDGDAVAARMLAGKPVIVAGDGTTPWTLTRSVDLALPFVGLLDKEAALREVFHITGDKGFTWNEIYAAIGRGLGVVPQIVHVPTDTLIRYEPSWAGPLLGDKTWTALFDNSKVKRVAGPFTCATDIDVVLEEPLRHLRRRQAAGLAPGANAALMDRIAAEQGALGQ
jgi:nucleoside-diphosphate-sugar epimerase